MGQRHPTRPRGGQHKRQPRTPAQPPYTPFEWLHRLKQTRLWQGQKRDSNQRVQHRYCHTPKKQNCLQYWKSRVWLAHCSTLTAKQPLMQPRVKLHNVNDSPFMTQGHPHWCALTASTAVTTRTNVPARTLGLRVVLGHVVQQQRPAEGAVPTLEVHAGVLPQEALVRRRKRGRVRRLIPQVARSRNGAGTSAHTTVHGVRHAQ